MTVTMWLTVMMMAMMTSIAFDDVSEEPVDADTVRVVDRGGYFCGRKISHQSEILLVLKIRVSPIILSSDTCRLGLISLLKVAQCMQCIEKVWRSHGRRISCPY
jgi:hypothetical protein